MLNISEKSFALPVPVNIATCAVPLGTESEVNADDPPKVKSKLLPDNA